MKKIKSVRIKLFITLCIVVLAIVFFLIIANSVILETFYLYSKSNSLKKTYIQINEYYSVINSNINLNVELDKISINNNFDIIIKDNQNITLYTTNKDFISGITRIKEMYNWMKSQEEIIEENEKVSIKRVSETSTNINYILLSGKLDNGNYIYIRTPITSIQESVRISNKFLYLIGIFVIFAGGIVVAYISKRFSKPIQELNNIAKKMSNLDFSHKYEIEDAEDEISDLGKSINTMSEKLEKTIKQLRNTNIELEKDIEEKSKIDEMRKSFISDVSHELKSPIALIQGYSEGLLENVNADEESRKFYAEVILDETNKMDKLVKQLLDLMKLEYEKREFDNKEFNILELEEECIRKSKVVLEEKNIQIEFDLKENITVFADDFYIEQVFNNYFTNAIKHVKEVEGRKLIKITNEIDEEKNIVKVSIFNTGNNIEEENLNRIWTRFFKEDESRNRDDGSSGLGLAIVKAIMNNYGLGYGVENKENGVEFYFECRRKER